MKKKLLYGLFFIFISCSLRRDNLNNKICNSYTLKGVFYNYHLETYCSGRFILKEIHFASDYNNHKYKGEWNQHKDTLFLEFKKKYNKDKEMYIVNGDCLYSNLYDHIVYCKNK